MEAPATAGGRTGADDAKSLGGDAHHIASGRPGRKSVLRRQRVVTRMHALGPRALYHALDEIGDPAWRIIERYAAGLTPALLAAIGADRFPPAPIEVVR